MAKGEELVHVPPTERVSDAEVEQFKLMRFAEKEFWNKIKLATDELQLKVGVHSRLVGSMRSIMRRNGV